MDKKEDKQSSSYCNFTPKDRRGQGLSVTTIILLVLGILVLIILILGFTIGWDKFAPWLSKNNVQTIAGACSVACDMGSKYDFCTFPRELKDEEGNKIKTTCGVLSNVDDYVSKYAIQKCSTLCDQKPCAQISLVVNGDELKGELSAPGTSCVSSEVDVSSLASDSVSNSADPTMNEYCCAKKV